MFEIVSLGVFLCLESLFIENVAYPYLEIVFVLLVATLCVVVGCKCRLGCSV